MLISSLSLHSQDISWAAHWGAGGDQSGFGCFFDSQGNYIWGGANHSSSPKLVFGKLDAQGNSIFTHSLDGNSWGYPHGVGVDSLDNIYYAGSFDKTVDFDPGMGISQLIAGNDFKIFVVKYAPDGSFRWVKSLGTGLESSARGLTVDNRQNIIVTGSWDEDIFFSKFDNTGNILFTKILECAPKYSTGYDVKTDVHGNIYISGHIDDSVDFDPDINVTHSVTRRGPFLAKYDSSGDFIWVRHALSYTNNAIAYGLTLDHTGNIYIGGYYSYSLNFSSDNSQVMQTNSSNDMFLARFDTSGIFYWQNSYGGPGDDKLYSIELVSDTLIAFGGYLRDSVNFGDTGLSIKSVYGQDPFMALADSSGKVIKVFHFPTTLNASLFDVTYSNNRIGITGQYSGEIDLAPDRTGYNFNAGGTFQGNAFMASFCAQPPLIVDSVSGPDTVCLSDTFTLSVQPAGAVTYAWNLPPAYQIVGKADTNVIRIATIDGAQSGTISVSVTDGCSAPKTSPDFSIVIMQNEVVLTLENPSGTCKGEDVIVFASQYHTYLIFINSNFYATVTDNIFLFAGKDSSFSLDARYTDHRGCFHSTPPVVVNFIPLPKVEISSDKPSGESCDGSPVTFTASGADTLSIFRNGSKFSGTNYTTNDLGNNDLIYAYGVTVEGCKAFSDTLSLLIKPLPDATLVCDDPDLTVGLGQSITFRASGGDEYEFNRNSNLVQNSTDSVYNLTNPNNGDQIYATVLLNGCEAATSTLVVTVNTGIMELPEDVVKLYPVPVRDRIILHIDMPGNYTVAIYGPLGQKVLSSEIHADQNHEASFDLSPYLQATYYVRVSSKDGQKIFFVPVLH